MSDLENESRHIIGPLIHDLSIGLNPARQFTIAKWAIKTAMTGETISRSARAFFYTEAERIQLRLSRFPSRTLVWLGRYSGRFDVGLFGVDGWNKEPKEPDVLHAYVSTILLRHLVIQVISIHAPREYSGAVKLRHRVGPWKGSLLKLDPFGSGVLSWPPLLTFTDEGSVPLRDLVQRCSIGTHIGPISPLG